MTRLEVPGKALRDAEGRFLCVPMVDGVLIVPDTDENLAKAYAMTEAELRAAPNGVHAQIRTRDT